MKSANLPTTLLFLTRIKPSNALRWRRPARPAGAPARISGLAALIAVTIVAAGCSSGSSEQIAVNGTESPISVNVIEEVENALGIDRAEIDFSNPIILEPSTCLLHGAWPSQALNAQARYFAQIPGQPVIQGPAEGAPQAVLQACFDEAGISPSADSVATAVLRLDATQTRLQPLTPNMATFLEPYGVPYHEPKTVENGDTSVTTFFANDFEVVGVLQVTVTRASDGSLTIGYNELAS